jgi:hypothetical protein
MNRVQKALSKNLAPAKKEKNGKHHASKHHFDEMMFPFEAFDKTIIGDMALWLEKTYAAPLSVSCMTGLGMYSTVLGQTVQGTGAYPKPSWPNLFVIIGADSADFKSNVYELFKAPMEEWMEIRKQQFELEKETMDLLSKDLTKQLKVQVEESKDALIKLIDSNRHAEATDTLPEAQVRLNGLKARKAPQVFISDGTAEVIEILAQSNGGCIGIWNDEGSRNLSLMLGGRYSNSAHADLSLWNSLWSSSAQHTYRVDKDRGDVSVPKMTGSLVLLAQPTIVDQLVQHGETTAQGLISRILTHMIPTEVRIEEGDLPDYPENLLKKWKRKIEKILNDRFNVSDEPPKPTDIQFSKNAKKYLREVQNRMNQEGVHFPLIYPFAKRVREHAIRIGINLAHLKGLTHVDENLAKQCVKIVEWHYSKMKEIMFSLEKETNKDDLEKLKSYIASNDGKVHKRLVHVNLHIPEPILTKWMDDGDLKGIEIWKEDGKKFIGLSELKPEAD